MSGRRGLARNGGMRRGIGLLAAACAVAAGWSLPAAAAERSPAPRRAIVDPGVVQAGGVCHGCRDPHCRTCRLHHHHAGCRDGKCHPHCPVRPQEFGFYGTQWRRWPGQGVVPVANVQEATPTRPPKSAVPGPDEESRGPRAGELPAPEPDAIEPAPAAEPAAQPTEPPAEQPARQPAAEPTVPSAKEPAPLLPVEPETPAAPAPEPPAPEPVTPAPSAKEPADKDLFDESATGPVRRRFAVRPTGTLAQKAQPAAVRPATLTYPSSAELQLPPPTDGWQPRVPRVPFDPATEAARLGR